MKKYSKQELAELAQGVFRDDKESPSIYANEEGTFRNSKQYAAMSSDERKAFHEFKNPHVKESENDELKALFEKMEQQAVQISAQADQIDALREQVDKQAETIAERDATIATQAEIVSARDAQVAQLKKQVALFEEEASGKASPGPLPAAEPEAGKPTKGSKAKSKPEGK